MTFLIFQLGPRLANTSPVYFYVGKIPYPPGSVQLKLLEHRFGFDQPLFQQYWNWLHGILFGRTVDRRHWQLPSTAVRRASATPSG